VVLEKTEGALDTKKPARANAVPPLLGQNHPHTRFTPRTRPPAVRLRPLLGLDSDPSEIKGVDFRGLDDGLGQLAAEHARLPEDGLLGEGMAGRLALPRLGGGSKRAAQRERGMGSFREKVSLLGKDGTAFGIKFTRIGSAVVLHRLGPAPLPPT
jgi:hypothetical protein